MPLFDFWNFVDQYKIIIMKIKHKILHKNIQFQVCNIRFLGDHGYIIIF